MRALFEVAAGSGAITALVSFNGANGQSPEGHLVEDGSGNLYGTAALGGANGVGVVFENISLRRQGPSP